jgi:hypothetical protein
MSTDFVELLWRAFPSHGRGRRFNPYSAHHFTGASRQYPAVAGRTIRKRARKIGAKSVQSVHGAYGPSNELKAILKTELLMRGDQLRCVTHRIRVAACSRAIGDLTSEGRDD